jgi:hypothetical protein
LRTAAVFSAGSALTIPFFRIRAAESALAIFYWRWASINWSQSEVLTMMGINRNSP